MDRKQQKRRAPIIEALEPRVLFSADMFGGAVDSPATNDSLATLLDDTAAVLDKQAAQLHKEQTDKARSEPLPEDDDVTSVLAEDSTPIELVFVDTDTPNYQQLVDDVLSASDDSRRFEVVLLDNDRNGIDQITATLQGYQGVGAIHLISHGADGTVDLGNTQLNHQNLSDYQNQLKSWADYLDANADILFYGCDLAASADGQNLIDEIATLTGADIAASDDLTGHSALGGDWELEYSKGQIDTQIAFSDYAQATWQGSLSQSLWLSTDSNVSSPGADGLASWTEGQVLEFSGPTLTHGDATDGDFSMVIDFDTFTLDAVDAGALHFVSQDMTVGGVNGTFDLKAGDVLVSFLQDETILAAYSSTGSDMLVGDQDLLVFRPNAFNDYSAGTFSVLLDEVVVDDLKGVTLIEQDTTIGGTDIAAGSFLLISEVSGTTSIDLFVPTGVGATTTTGTVTPLIDLSGLGIDPDMLRGIEVIEAATSIGGQSLAKGDILATLRANDGAVGSNGLAVDLNDVFVLSLTSTGMGTTAGTATMFLDGSDVGLDNNPSTESPYALALYNYSQLTVDTTSDVFDGDTSSIEALLLNKGADGKISLREAIEAANATPNGDIADVIRFNITDPLVNGAHTISVGSALPTITDTVVIDGSSEPDFSNAPVIRIDGASAGANVDGLSFSATSDNSIVRGLMITGFSRDGILVQSDADYLTFTGNWIGTSGTGSTGVGNGDDGIELRGSHATVGGTGANEGNVITNAGDEGLQISGTGVTAHLIQGNYIGLDPDGSSGSGNRDVGLAIISGSGNTIGGTTAGARNVISNNFEGIEVNTSNNIIQGNYIGTDAGGTLDRGNRSDDGIEIQSSATGNLIGGTETGAGNVIAFNALDGVNIVNGSGNTVLGNQIHSNGNLGIDLGTNGVTANDSNDADSGANNLQNFPVITAAELSGSNLTLSGTLDTNGPSGQFRVEFFGNTVGTQDATHGEGRFYLGSATLTTDVNGDGAFTDVTLSGVTLGEGDYVTATATRIDDSGQLGSNDQLAYGDTSEFAANVAITGTNIAPEVTASAGSTGYSEQETAVVIDSSVALVDPDGSDGADPSSQYIAEVQITGNYTLDDVLGFTNTANIQGDLVGSVLTLSVISGQTATVAEFEAALQSVTFYNGSDTPSDLNRTISFSFNDGVDSSNVATKVVQVTAINDNSVVTLPSSPANYSVGGSAVIVDANATISDVDSVNFATGDLRVGFTGGTGTSNDVLSIRNQGTGPGEIGVAGGSVTYSGVVIGTYSGGTELGLLSIAFNTEATPEAVQALARNILYENLSSTPDTSDRQVRFELRDGDGGNSPNVFQTVNFNSAAVISGDTSFSGNEGDLVRGTLSATDVDGLTDGTYFTVSSQGSHGTAAIREGTGEWAFTPTNSDWFGTDQFTVTVTDDKGGTTEQVVSITLANVNDAPTDLVTTATSLSGISLNEDGNDAYLVADNGLPSPLSQFTVEVQFTGNSFSNEVPFISYNTPSGDMLTINTMANNTLELDIGTGAVAFSSAINYNATLMDGQRHTLSVSWDNVAGDWSVYIDGALIDSGTGLSTGQTIPTGGTLMFGLEQDSVGGTFESHEYFNGELYDIRLFDDVRTATEIATHYTDTLPSNEPGMVANWIFDNLSSSGRIVESVGGNDLTVQHFIGTGFTSSNPTLILSALENAPNGTVVGTLSTIDPDNGDGFSYTLVDNAGGRFDIDSATGEIRVLNGSLIDYETAASHDITVRVTDAGGLSYDEIFSIQVVNLNDAPAQASIESGPLAYTENDGAVAITSTLTISDVDDTNIESAIVQITTGYNSSEDVLSFTDQNGITGSYNATDGTWTLTGTATLAQYESALRSITYSNSSENPDTTTRIVSFTVNDGDANSNTQTRNIEITAANDAPVLAGANDLAAIDEDPSSNAGTPVSDLIAGQVSDSDTGSVEGIAVVMVDDANGTWQYTTDGGTNWTAFGPVDAATSRLLAADANTSVRFVPDANWNGAVTNGITFHAWDQTTGMAGGTADLSTGIGGTTAFSASTASSSITVNAVTDLTAQDDSFTLDEDAVLTNTVAINDSTTSGGALSYALASGVSNGSLTLNNDGSFTYTPTANYHGSDGFTYTVTDAGSGESATQTVSLTINPVDDAVTIGGDTSGSGAEDTAISGTLTASDNADGLTDGTYFTVSTGASNGTASIDPATGLWSYTPTADFNGSDSFTVTVTDDDGYTDTQVVSVTVTPVVDIVDDSLTTNEDTAITANVLTGTNGASADNFEGTPTLTAVTNGSNGTVSFLADGTVTYTPTANFNGSDSFTYTVTSGGVTETGTVNVTVNGVTDLSATDDSFTLDEDAVLTNTVAANDSTTSGGALSYAVTTDVTNGSLTLNADGSFTYTPTANYHGSDSFTYTVTDAGSGESATRTVSLTISSVDDAVTIGGDKSGSGAEDTAISGTLTASDSADGLTDGTYFTVSTDGTNGTASIDPATGLWSYTPAADFNGSDSFTVTVTDDDGYTATQVVSVTVTPVVDIVDDSLTTNEDTAISANLLTAPNGASADDFEGTPSLTAVTHGSNGSVSFLADGTVTYTPDANFNGSDSFTYTITSGGVTETGTVNVTVNSVDDAAVITGDTSYSGNEGDAVSGDLNATDVDGLTDGTYFTVSAGATNGTAAIDSATGAWTFTPSDANWFGTDQFTVTVTDDEGGTTEQIVSITLANVDDAAVITGDTSFSGNEGDTVSGELNATDVDGLTDGSYFTVTGAATNGTAAIDSASGAWTFTPTDANWFGTDQFTVTVTDDLGSTTEQLVSITLTNVNDAPIGLVTITGTAVAGETLNASNTLTDADGMGPVSYVWKADGVQVGAGTTYTLTQAEVGKIVTLEARYTDGEGFAEVAASFATTAVVERPQLEPALNPELEFEPELEPEPEPEVEPDPETEAELDSEAEPKPKQLQGPGSVAVGAERLLSIDDDVLAQVLTNVFAVTEGYDYQSKAYKVVLPKTLDLLNLDLTPFQPESNEFFELVSPTNNASLANGLDQMKRDLDDIALAEDKNKMFKTEAMLGATMGLSAGFISWVLRAGSLMAGFMSITPLWRQLDPMPILGGTEKKDLNKDVEDEASEGGRSVEEIFADEDSDR